MSQFLLLVVIAIVVAALVFGIGALVSGSDPGVVPVHPDDGHRGLPGDRPLAESDLHAVRFDTVLRGYRMAQVDAVLARTAYDVGFKQELIEALQAEVAALREGRTEDAEVLRKAREAAMNGGAAPSPAGEDSASESARLGQPGSVDAADGADPATSVDPEHVDSAKE